MLNSTTLKLGSISNNIQLNTPCTGILQKSNPNSKFIRCNMESEVAKNLLDDKLKPHIFISQNSVEVTILQVLIFGDNQLLIEVIENSLISKD